MIWSRRKSATSYVSAVMVAALLRRRFVHDVADPQAEHFVDRAHLLRVAADEVVVDGDDVHRLARPAP
jgi:hypothetical protein